MALRKRSRRNVRNLKFTTSTKFNRQSIHVIDVTPVTRALSQFIPFQSVCDASHRFYPPEARERTTAEPAEFCLKFLQCGATHHAPTLDSGLKSDPFAAKAVWGTG